MFAKFRLWYNQSDICTRTDIVPKPVSAICASSLFFH